MEKDIFLNRKSVIGFFELSIVDPSQIHDVTSDRYCQYVGFEGLAGENAGKKTVVSRSENEFECDDVTEFSSGLDD
ncbi:hypothetical protein ACFOZ7_18050 [Natribaculum luteum]|uniref:Transposase n=1 Tax=Natribaculum luteum TaxID=1586232 RepID=A0ABD5P3F8_9EURY|nr:hypothetical protein [Natribaculum luteum]